MQGRSTLHRKRLFPSFGFITKRKQQIHEGSWFNCAGVKSAFRITHNKIEKSISLEVGVPGKFGNQKWRELHPSKIKRRIIHGRI